MSAEPLFEGFPKTDIPSIGEDSADRSGQIEYSLLESRLSYVLANDPTVAKELDEMLGEHDRSSPLEAISTYAYLACSEDPSVIDVVCTHLPSLLTLSLPEDQLQTVRDIWVTLLHPVDVAGQRSSDDRAYLAQEAYYFSRPNLDAETIRQLDPERWDEFQGPMDILPPL